MKAFGEPKILILASDLTTARRWATMLRGPEAGATDAETAGPLVWLSPGEVPRNGRPDVILADGVPTVESSEHDPPAVVGIVRLGGSGPADVELPEDVSARELRTVCRLLAELVRLRRKEQAGTELRQQLAEQALTDPLTGLPNRRAWDQALAQRLAQATDSLAAADPQRLCLAIFDLDHFKHINDVHGHALGDEVLRVSGRAIRQGLRDQDFVARLGGDEFGLLLRIHDEPTAAGIVDRVRTSIFTQLAQAALPKVTASTGYCLGPSAEASCSIESCYASAAAALREAKRQGRDRTTGAASIGADSVRGMAGDTD